MANVPVFQVNEGEWTSERWWEVFGSKISHFFTSDPGLLADFISSFQTRPDDVFVVSYPKSGTTWVQEIVFQIYKEGAISNEHILHRIPFLEVCTSDNIPHPDPKTLPSPRVIKTHLPYSATPKSANNDMQCKYIYVARNPKDVAVSYFHFMETLSRAFNNGFNGPFEFFIKLFIEGNVGWNLWNDHVLSWWKHRDDPNLLFLKYEDMHKDLPSHVRMIYDFLNKPLSDELLNRIAEQCAFKGMSENAESFLLGRKEDGRGLLRKGVIGDWKNYFTPEHNERFEKEVLAKLQGSGLEFDYC